MSVDSPSRRWRSTGRRVADPTVAALLVVAFMVAGLSADVLRRGPVTRMAQCTYALKSQYPASSRAVRWDICWETAVLEQLHTGWGALE